jgi:hypothetical protein
MRILKIRLSGLLKSSQPGVDLDAEPIRAQLFRDLESLRFELAERIRSKALGYLPEPYSVFVRVSFEPSAKRMVATFWIDDPAVSGMSGILARRAWKLSLPILAHVFREAVQERLQTFSIDVEDGRSKIEAFAATRGWYSPPVLAVLAVTLTSLFWIYGLPWLKTMAVAAG